MLKIWDYHVLKRMNLYQIVVIFLLMLISLLVISSQTATLALPYGSEETFFTPYVKSQIQWFILGSAIYCLVTAFDYNKLREWTWLFYLLMLLLLFGLFFANPIQKVHRWYRIPLLNISLQPSEFAKLIVVLALSWILERRRRQVEEWSTIIFVGLITGIPFLLILNQPDLGSAIVLYPIIIGMLYFAESKPLVIKTLAYLGLFGLIFTTLIFLHVIPFETIQPYAKTFLRDYQIERLNPNVYHQKSSTTAIAIGGIVGTGWKKGEFSARGWLPASHTDSVFAALGEEFGLLGLLFLIFLFYSLIHFGFQVTLCARNYFGRLLSAGITMYLAMHILVNIGMMCGILPITGVPLPLISYGGSSIFVTMTALGTLQSIYSRRFTF